MHVSKIRLNLHFTYTHGDASDLLHLCGSYIMSLIQRQESFETLHHVHNSLQIRLFIINLLSVWSQRKFASHVQIPLWSGGWVNIKMPSYQYKKSDCGDKAILRPPYLHSGIPITDKMVSLHGIGHQICLFVPGRHSATHEHMEYLELRSPSSPLETSLILQI